MCGLLSCCFVPPALSPAWAGLELLLSLGEDPSKVARCIGAARYRLRREQFRRDSDVRRRHIVASKYWKGFTVSEMIVYRNAAQKFGCGEKYTNLTVLNFVGPGGVKVSAYSCNMNIDLDGEPQAYGSRSKPGVRPLDSLMDAGWLSEAQNAARLEQFKAAKAALQALEKKKLERDTKAKSAPISTETAHPDAAGTILEKQIADATKALKAAAGYWHDEPEKRPVNFGKKFWHWYGLIALTPAEALARSHLEMVGDKKILRKPVIDKASAFEDVYGRFPVVQSAYEPGPDYFVSALPSRVNPFFPDWDQRSYLPVGATTQIPNAALSIPLENVTGLRLNDKVFAIRLDTGKSLAFPFLDHGYKAKVGECSIGAFVGLDGVVAERVNASKNDFVLLYLAFANSAVDTPQAKLVKLASAVNAEDFPILLSFIADATLQATTASKTSTVTVGGDPIRNFEKWKKSGSTTYPSSYAVISESLSNAGFNPQAQRVLRKHPSLLGGAGPWLKIPDRD